MHPLFNTPGVAEQAPEATENFIFNHSMIRIKAPEASLDFYTRVIGMQLLRKDDFEEHQFSLYFLGFVDKDEQVPEDEAKRKQWVANRSGILELTHNHGTEDDPDAGYHSGNDEPKGFGHLCISVPDFEAAIQWFDDNNVVYQKRPEDGFMKNIAFIKDPDGYWIEIIGQ